MTIQEIRILFKENLQELYSDSEINGLFMIFVQEITGYSRFEIRQNDKMLLTAQSETLKFIAEELRKGKPYQQILGFTEFFGLKFFVDENVLIPRPETEELLEIAINEIKAGSRKSEVLKILDIGTGSGIIPIVLKKHFPLAEISAIDFSENALKVAKRNADFHQLEINFIHQDYLNCELTEIFDVIISNPPYIGMEEKSDIADSVKAFEPKMALFSPTSNALIFYGKIADDCQNHLTENGLVFLEINQKLGQETRELFVDVLSEVELIKDLSGNDRFVVGRK